MSHDNAAYNAMQPRAAPLSVPGVMAVRERKVRSTVTPGRLWLILDRQVSLHAMSDFDARAEYGFPPKIDDFFGAVEPTGSPHDPGWDYRLWVEEWAEAYLGAEPFASLERRFAATPGVTEVTHMDREVFLLKSQLQAERLRELLWTHFIAAAQERVGRDA